MLVVGEGHLPKVTPPLAVWPISSNATWTREFQERLQTSFSHHGNISPHSRTTPSSRGGLAGALNGISILGPIEGVVNFLLYPSILKRAQIEQGHVARLPPVPEANVLSS